MNLLAQIIGQTRQKLVQRAPQTRAKRGRLSRLLKIESLEARRVFAVDFAPEVTRCNGDMVSEQDTCLNDGLEVAGLETSTARGSSVIELLEKLQTPSGPRSPIKEPEDPCLTLTCAASTSGR